MAQLQNISHTHDQIMNWLIANPEKKLAECAAHFGYTQAWLSQIIHSDIFQAALKERQGVVFGRIAASTEERLAGLAFLATEKLTDALEKTGDNGFILDSFDKIMHRAGYAPGKNIVQSAQQVNNFYVTREDLDKARKAITDRAAAGSAPAPVIEGEATLVESSRGGA
jgi:hypothetical protein